MNTQCPNLAILNNSPLMDIFFLYVRSIIIGVIVILTYCLYVRDDTFNKSDNKNLLYDNKNFQLWFLKHIHFLL